MKKMTCFVMALALALGFTQCKKEQTPTNNASEGVRITLNVGDESRAVVTPGFHNQETGETYAKVEFEAGDEIYVGYKGLCVGSLVYSDGTFSGTVTISEGDYGEKLHFYFLGGTGFAPTINGNTASVVISDQSSKYPVISYAASKENYTGGGSYSAILLNKCAMVKFNLSTGTDATVSAGGLYTKATIDFANPGVVTPSNHGSITLHSGESNTERWAILLPQTGVLSTATISGYAYSIPNFPDIAINDYNTTGVSISTENPIKVVDLSTISDGWYQVTEKVILTGTP